MNIFIFLLGLMSAGPLWAQQNCSMGSKPVKDIKSLCDELNKKNADHCRVEAPVKKETLPPVSYGIFSASGKMKSLFEKMEALQKSFLKDEGGCPGGCSKVGSPVVELSTRPTAVEADPACPTSYTALKLSAPQLEKFGVGQSEIYFKKSFRFRADSKKCQEEASGFAQSTLMGDNEFGKFLEQEKCKTPCSYSSTIRIKTNVQSGGECGVDLELAILCGPPKKDREWVTQASLVKSYRCEVAP